MNPFDVLPLAGLFIITAILTGRIVILKRKGINVNSGSEKRKNYHVLLYAAFSLIFFVWLSEIIQPIFKLSYSILPRILTKRLIENIFMSISGSILIILSLILLTITIIHFKNSLRFGLDKRNKGELMTGGLFSISRNPFFLSLEFYFVGVTLISTSLFFIGFTFLTIISIHFFILKEEKFLRKVFGDEYEKYRKKVRRYI